MNGEHLDTEQLKTLYADLFNKLTDLIEFLETDQEASLGKITILSILLEDGLYAKATNDAMEYISLLLLQNGLTQ